MSLLTSDYDYPLPEHLIARHPTARRDGSRMMVLHRESQRIEHRNFSDFPGYISDGDLVVLNDTRVFRARAFSDDGRVEFLFLETVATNTWRCLVKPGRRARPGATVSVGGIAGVVKETEETGERIIEFAGEIDLEKHGELPLPPYFERDVEKEDDERYQTVFAKKAGAVAAPTAGLHFTPEILANLPHAFLTLHVGVGTFRPVQADNLAGHQMHTERYEISEQTAAAVNAAKRIVAIGTTTTRVLESTGLPLTSCSGSTNIFIHPPYQFRAVDVLLTNFHLPKSTLLMLISAFAEREFILRAYEEAIRENYRFYSYGDCMLIL